MKKCIIWFSILLFLSPMVMAQDLKLSMLPRYFPEKQTQMISPLSHYLSKALEIPVSPMITENFKRYEETIRKGIIQIGYENPLVYVNIADTHEVIAMALKGQGSHQFRGIIITRPDSGISYLKDLKGKKVMIVGRNSAGGFLSQKLSLKKAGIDVEKECEIEEAVDNKQENVLIAVSVGDADVGFIRESSRFSAEKYIQPGSIKVMSYCEWLPNWALSVNRKLPVKVKERVKESILNLKKDHPVLNAMGLKGFAPATDEQYDIMRDILSQ